MHKNREGNLVSDTHRNCTKCGVIFERTSKNMSICHKCNTERVKSGTPEYKMLGRAKQRAISKGMEFNLELSDIIVPERCPILDIPIKQNSGKPGAYRDSHSLDRIDNKLGYIKGNVQVISQMANAMKGGADTKDLVKFAEWITRTYDEYGELRQELVLDNEVRTKKSGRIKYDHEEVLKHPIKEAMLKFGISKGYYNMIKKQKSLESI